jgi:hypothetical protein
MSTDNGDNGGRSGGGNNNGRSTDDNGRIDADVSVKRQKSDPAEGDELSNLRSRSDEVDPYQ